MKLDLLELNDHWGSTTPNYQLKIIQEYNENQSFGVERPLRVDPSSIQQIPLSATSATGTPCSCAINPSTENMATPPYKLVALFTQTIMSVSLEKKSDIQQIDIVVISKIIIDTCFK